MQYCNSRTDQWGGSITWSVAAHWVGRGSAVNVAWFPLFPTIAAVAPVKAGSIDHGSARGLAEDRDDSGLGHADVADGTFEKASAHSQSFS